MVSGAPLAGLVGVLGGAVLATAAVVIAEQYVDMPWAKESGSDAQGLTESAAIDVLKSSSVQREDGRPCNYLQSTLKTNRVTGGWVITCWATDYSTGAPVDVRGSYLVGDDGRVALH